MYENRQKDKTRTLTRRMARELKGHPRTRTPRNAR